MTSQPPASDHRWAPVVVRSYGSVKAFEADASGMAGYGYRVVAQTWGVSGAGFVGCILVVFGLGLIALAFLWLLTGVTLPLVFVLGFLFLAIGSTRRRKLLVTYQRG